MPVLSLLQTLFSYLPLTQLSLWHLYLTFAWIARDTLFSID